VGATPADAGDEVLPRRVGPSSVDAAEDARAPERASLTLGGSTREYVLVVPSAIDRASPLPLVLAFHGDGGDAWGFHTAFPFERASRGDAIVAYLDGVVVDAHVGRTWALGAADPNPDIAFVEALVDSLSARLPVDRARIFATGYSSGAFFSNLLACRRSDLVRAIASNAGGSPFPQAEKWPNGYPKCPGQKGVAAILLHGSADQGVTLDSGFFSAEYWASVNGCGGELDPTGYPECAAYRRCPRGKAVVWCEVPGLGHWVWDHAAEVSWVFSQRQ
jgi:polyhydroxybutyrate depolymerase